MSNESSILKGRKAALLTMIIGVLLYFIERGTNHE
ncbi:MAG: hypothetical protein JG777_103 [Clostridia bacterium]|jgi:hypothetical protein|nr:hypothetical protein [Clostridia bacterium]